MAETSRPWPGTTIGDAGPYDSNSWNDAWLSISRAGGRLSRIADYGIGVFYGIANALEPTSNVTEIDVDTGASLIDGLYHENDASVAIPIPASGAGTSRIDVIVVRKNYQQAVTYTPGGGAPTVPFRTARITVIRGVEAAGPVAPALTQDTTRTTYWDIPIAQVQVDDAGALSNFTDLREFVGNNFGVSTLSADNGIFDVISLETTVSDGNGANGLGAAIKFKLEDSVGTLEDAGQIAVIWSDATSGSEDSKFELRLESGGSENLGMVMRAPLTASADGNTRGYGSVDLQQVRTVAAQVASGNYAFACGTQNTVSGDYSFASGVGNTASGSRSTAEGGNTVASGDYSHAEGRGTTAGDDQCHAEGNSTTASGTASHAEGDHTTASGINSHAEGDYTTASGQYSHAGGSYAVSSKFNQFSRAGGRFAVDGDAQYSDYCLRRSVTHSDANWYKLYLNGSSSIITVAADTVMTFDVLIAGTTQGCTKSFSFRIVGIIENDGGTTSLLASTVTTIYDGDDTDFDARASADDANDALLIEVTDSTSGGDTVRWVAVVRTSEVSFPA